MKIFILERDEYSVDYDEFAGQIVRANNESEARKMANSSVGDEGKIWDDKKLVTCKQVKVSGKAEILLADFRAG